MDVANLRREPDVELKSFSLTLPIEVVELLEKHSVKSQRGGGNLSAFLEIGALVSLGIFTNPKLATDNLIRLFNPASNEVYTVSENLEMIAKQLLDLLE